MYVYLLRKNFTFTPNVLFLLINYLRSSLNLAFVIIYMYIF